ATCRSFRAAATAPAKAPTARHRRHFPNRPRARARTAGQVCALSLPRRPIGPTFRGEVAMFQRGSLTVLRVRGVPIRLHVSVLLLVPFLAWVVAAQTAMVADAAELPPARLGLPGWAWGAIAAV